MSVQVTAAKDLKPITVLLVEDDVVAAEGVKRGFRQEKITNEIVNVKDGVEALEWLRERPEGYEGPYVILLDLNLPRMSGIEFLAEIRADESLRKSIVFVLTTSNSDTDRSEAYKYNVAGYMVKENAGEEFQKLAAFIDAYWRLVELPQNGS